MHFAPRYDERMIDIVIALDDPGRPIAETCRRVGDAAAALDLPRPGYVHLRRVVHAERERAGRERLRADAVRRVWEDVAVDLLAGRRVDAFDVADRLRRVRSG